MTSAVDMAPSPIGVRFMGFTLAQVRAILVWLMFASSFYVAVEPAPSDFLFLVVLACFLGSGLAISATVMPFVVFLLLYNFGGFISFLQVAGDERARMFVITSFYMAFSAIFLAFYVALRSASPHGHCQKRACHCRGDRIAFGNSWLFRCGGTGRSLFPEHESSPAHSRIQMFLQLI